MVLFVWFDIMFGVAVLLVLLGWFVVVCSVDDLSSVLKIDEFCACGVFTYVFVVSLLGFGVGFCVLL